jgi:hypothetical protein
MPEWTRELWRDFWKAPFHVAFWNSWAWMGGNLWAWFGAAVIAGLLSLFATPAWKYTFHGIFFAFLLVLLLAIIEKIKEGNWRRISHIPKGEDNVAAIAQVQVVPPDFPSVPGCPCCAAHTSSRSFCYVHNSARSLYC